MAMKITKVDLWAATLRDKPGSLAKALAPLARAGANFGAVLARRSPDKKGRGVVFVTPIRGGRQKSAARRAGFKPARDVAGLRIDCPDAPGLCACVAGVIADAGVNLRGFNAKAVGKRCCMYLGFDTAADAAKAARALRKC